jgi:hypothetical protein
VSTRLPSIILIIITPAVDGSFESTTTSESFLGRSTKVAVDSATIREGEDVPSTAGEAGVP